MSDPATGIPFEELSEQQQIARLRYAIATLSHWLVQAQTGYGRQDDEALMRVLREGSDLGQV